MCINKESSRNSKSKTLQPDRQLHDHLSAYVIAQQYSPTTFVSLGFHPRKDKSGAFKKLFFFPIFSFKIS
jgi:hypothetical protein